MPAIVTIGYTTYAVKSIKAAQAIVAAMAEAVEVDEAYTSGLGYSWYPTRTQRGKVAMEIVKPEQLTPCKPGTEEPAAPRPQKQLDYNGKVFYQ